MVRCSVLNCTSSIREGWKFHRFPADNERRKIWLENCGRKQWIPGPSAVICSRHFEDSQYELNRVDGSKLLKKSAVPTLFGVQIPLQTLSNAKGIGCSKPDSILTSHPDDSDKSHFGESHYEINGADERRLQKKSAVSSFFGVQSPLQTLNNFTETRCPKPDFMLTSHPDDSDKENNQSCTKVY